MDLCLGLCGDEPPTDDEGKYAPAALKARFEQQYGPGGPVRVAAAPGRANVIGEHVDYQDGLVLPFALAQRCRIAFRPRDDDVLRVVAEDLDGATAEIELAPLATRCEEDAAAGPDVEPSFARYVAGPFVGLATGSPKGMDALICGDVPLGGGVSSSSALVVASAIAARCCNPGRLPKRADAADALLLGTCEAEWRFSGMRGGIMDQSSSYLGKPEKLLLLDCRLGKVTEEVPAVGAAFVVLNTMVAHSLPDSPYAKRRESCERAAAAMAARWPERKITHLRDAADRDEGPAMVEELATANAITAEDADRARHGVAEIRRVRAAVKAARNGDWPAVGALLDETHASLRDLYAVSCEELDIACEAAGRVDGVLGARMMGGGFGGCALALVEPAKAAAVRDAWRASYKTDAGVDPTVFVATPSGGATLDGVPAVDVGELWATEA